jgi:hypothetical protein
MPSGVLMLATAPRRAVRACRRIAILLGLSFSAPAAAQDDGARLYMMVPDRTTIASVRFHQLHSNVAADESTVHEDNNLDTTLGVFQFVQALRFGRDQAFVFLVVPASRIAANDVADGVSGLGDVQLGFVLGVHGTPALGRADYAAHRPGLAVNLLAKLFFPTGRYDPGRAVNIGANRWAARLGVPIVFAIGGRMDDPHLTTIEAMQTETLHGPNDEPVEAGRTHQRPLFLFEGHLTRALSPRFWSSLDLLWREGGEVRVDGIGAGNRQSALSLGATGTLALSATASLRLSVGGVVARNQHGPNGWMLRAILGTVF